MSALFSDAFGMVSARGLAAAVPAPASLLDPHAVYLSPRGRRCRLQGLSHGGTYATLVYELRNGTRSSSVHADAFTLSAANWLLLRRVA